MDLKSGAKVAAASVMALFMASKADAQTQKTGELQLGPRLTPSAFVDPVISQQSFGSKGEQRIEYLDGGENGSKSHVVLIVKDTNGNQIAEENEITGAYVRTKHTAQLDGQDVEIATTYDSGGKINETYTVPATIHRALYKDNGASVQTYGDDVKTTEQAVIRRALKELGHN